MKISSQRWKGRLEAVVPYLHQKGITINQGDTYNDLLIKVTNSSAFSNQEKVAFKSLLINGLTTTDERFDSGDDTRGRVDYEYVRTHFSDNVISKLVEETDYASLYEEELEQNRVRRQANRKRNIKIVVSVATIIMTGLIIYNLPYFAEKRAYSRTIKTPSIEIFNKYISTYDNEAHLPDVLYRKALYILSDNDSYNYDKARERECIETLDTLVALFPNHELRIKANETIDSIWTAEIEKFTQKNQNIQSSSSLSAMYEMLIYMKEHKVYDILLNVRSDVELKEYSDFPLNVRRIMEIYHPELTTNPVLKIKDYFGTPDQENLENSLISEFTKSINTLFTPDFFSVTTSHNKNTETSDLPAIDLGYSIKSQSIDIGGTELPSIWTYTSRSEYGIQALTSDPDKYIMGIEVSFDAKLTFPGQTEPWSIKIKGAPEEDINDIEDISDGYRVMTKKCFEQFGDKLYNLMGLSTANDD